MSKLKVLIVEDEIIASKRLKRTLIELGYEVVGQAKNSTESLVIFNNDKPDLAIVDIDLKNSLLDGIELAREFNKIQRIPIIYLTSHSEKILIERAKTTSPLAYLTKPCLPSQLSATIEISISNFVQRIGSSTQQKEERLFYTLQDSFFTKKGNTNIKIEIKDILWIEADSGSIVIFTEKEKIVVSASLTSFCNQVIHPSLMHVHRSYAVNINEVDHYHGRSLYVPYKNGFKLIPVNEKNMEIFKQKILRLKAD